MWLIPILYFVRTVVLPVLGIAAFVAALGLFIRALLGLRDRQGGDGAVFLTVAVIVAALGGLAFYARTFLGSGVGYF